VVEASSVEHIVKSVQFAAENNVRLVVKVLGHDLLGRYEFLEPGTIIVIVVLICSPDLLLPRHFQFGQPVCAGRHPTRVCLHRVPRSMVTQLLWRTRVVVWEMFTTSPRVSKYNMTFVGAADLNAGLSWCLTGGGHSPLGSEYGMASDNVLQLLLVTPTGHVLTANPCQNTDVFWAMRGMS
jgi:hypothetical protein